jgi:hypothetical protein
MKMKFGKWLIALALLVMLFSDAASAQAPASPTGGPMITTLYDVGDLLEREMFIQEQESGEMGMGDMSGMGMEGMGGMDSGMSMGMSEMGGGGMGMSSMGGGMMAQTSQALPSTDSPRMSKLIKILVDHLGNEVPWAFRQQGGGNLSALGRTLVVTHDASAHKKIASLLSALNDSQDDSTMVTVEIRILDISSESPTRAALADAQQGHAESLSLLADAEDAAHVSIRCANHRGTQIASGLKRSFVVNLTPVVGGEMATSHRSTGYRPEVQSFLLGLYGAVRPDVSADQKSARLDLQIRLASSPEEVKPSLFADNLSIDRVDIGMTELYTVVQSAPNQWTVAGVVASVSPHSPIVSGEVLNHQAILVRWTITP